MITVAKNAGFCFGVKRAVDTLYDALNNKRNGERIYTLGTLIHNGVFNAELSERGVSIAKVEELSALAESSTESSPVTVFLRAHGVPKETEALLEKLSKANSNFRYVDCTCPFVKKIHNIAKSTPLPTTSFCFSARRITPR
jgi:4-hydroxy-3-methylbut-2-enyl diphosphate reductase